MQENTHTGVFTTASAVAGGLGKFLFTRPVLLSVTADGLLTVMVYAGASAVIGYIVKIILDTLTRFFIKRFHAKEDAGE